MRRDNNYAGEFFSKRFDYALIKGNPALEYHWWVDVLPQGNIM